MHNNSPSNCPPTPAPTSVFSEMVADHHIWPRVNAYALTFHEIFGRQFPDIMKYFFHIYLGMVVEFHFKWSSQSIIERKSSFRISFVLYNGNP